MPRVPHLLALARALFATAGRSGLVRAIPIYMALTMAGAIVLSPHGVRPADLTGAALTSLPTRVVMWAVWILLILPVVRSAIASPSAIFVRAMPYPAWLFVALHGVFVLLAQAAWFALWSSGRGFFSGAAAGVGAAAISSWIVARPRRASEWAMLATLTIAAVGTNQPVLCLVAGTSMGVVGVSRAWLRAPEHDRGSPMSWIAGPATMAIALTFATKVAREETSTVVRSGLLALAGTIAAIGLARNAADGNVGVANAYGMAAMTLPLAIGGATVATRVIATETQLRWLLDTTAVSGRVRVAAATVAVVGPCATLGALGGAGAGAIAFATAGAAARMAVSCTVWGVGIAVVALACATRERTRRDPTRIVSPMAATAFVGMTVAGLAGEVGALGCAVAAAAVSLTTLVRRPIVREGLV